MRSIIAILITLTGFSAFAQYDRSDVVLRCREERPTYQQLEVVVARNRAGRYEMRIARGARRPTVRTYQVEVRTTGRVGSPTSYRNAYENVTLTINYSSAPDRRGERGATLNTREGGREVLLCRR